MAASVPTPEYSQSFVLRGGLGEESRQVQRSLLDAIGKLDFDESSCFAIRLALEEALSNAVKHGNGGDPEKVVRIDCNADRSTVKIEIEDEGEGFDPHAVPDPTQEENLEIPSGRGIVLMKSFMSDISYNDSGNRVSLTFKRGTDVP